jgi:hypothetical protein
VGIGTTTAIRGITFPAAAGSMTWDKALKATGREVLPQTYGFHVERGLKNTVKVPCVPIAMAGWGLPLLEEKTFGKFNLRVAKPKERNLEVALKDNYWETVGDGVGKLIQLHFNVVAIPGAVVSATHDPINKALGYNKNDNSKKNILFHGMRGTGMVLCIPIIATGGLVTAGGNLVKKATGKETETDKTLNGYDYSLGGLAKEGIEDAVRAVAFPTYTANAVLTQPLDGKNLPEREKNEYFEASGKGLLQVVALPVLAPSMVIGAGGLMYDKATKTENRDDMVTCDHSVVGLGNQGLNRTARGAKWAYVKVVEPAVKNTFKAIAKAYNSMGR